ncbi:MAG: hypothetical protein ACYC5O_19185 [Anaerolineae bacterium]
MVSIVVRMVVSDAVFVAGVLLLMLPADGTKLLAPAHALGWAAVLCGGVASAWLTLSLVRYSMSRRAAGGRSDDDGR